MRMRHNEHLFDAVLHNIFAMDQKHSGELRTVEVCCAMDLSERCDRSVHGCDFFRVGPVAVARHVLLGHHDRIRAVNVDNPSASAELGAKCKGKARMSGSPSSGTSMVQVIVSKARAIVRTCVQRSPTWAERWCLARPGRLHMQSMARHSAAASEGFFPLLLLPSCTLLLCVLV
mmetsp:Transcript_6405/g.40006  ORF Transcript_6405/g.40006 Transcript_6405/m.40006 type:complete len:174 (+) Transcript_6405:446-967(+)